MGRKKAGSKHVAGEDLLRVLHAQNAGKLRAVVKAGLDLNGNVDNTSCFDNTTWVLRDRHSPVVPLLVFACFNGIPAPMLDLMLKLGASPNAVTDCGLPAPMAVLCSKATPEEHRALFQVLRQHRCATFNARVRSARNPDAPLHVATKLLDLSDWGPQRKAEGVELLVDFGTFELLHAAGGHGPGRATHGSEGPRHGDSGGDGSDSGDGVAPQVDEQAVMEFVAAAVRQPFGHRLLACLWRRYPQILLPASPHDTGVLLSAVTASWADPDWAAVPPPALPAPGAAPSASGGGPTEAAAAEAAAEAAEERRRCLTQGLVLRALQQRCVGGREREALASWLRANAVLLFCRPDLLPPLLTEQSGGGGGAAAEGTDAAAAAAAGGDAVGGAAHAPPAPPHPPLPLPPVLSADAADCVLPVGLLAGPGGSAGGDPEGDAGLGSEAPLAGRMSLLLAYTVEPDERLARAGVELLLSRGARVDVPCFPGRGVLGEGAEAGISPLLAAFMPFQRDNTLVKLLWRRFAECHPEAATQQTALRLRAAAHTAFLALPGWREALRRDAAAEAAAAATVAADGAGAADAAVAAGLAAADAVGGGAGGVPLVCSRERLRELLECDLLDYVDARNLDQVETVLAEAVAALTAPPPPPAAAALDAVCARLDAAAATLEALYDVGRSDEEVAADPAVWAAEAEVEALEALQRCLLRVQTAAAGGGEDDAGDGAATAASGWPLPPGVAFTEVLAARIASQPESGLTSGLLLHLGICQLRHALRAVTAAAASGGGGGAAAALGAASPGPIVGGGSAAAAIDAASLRAQMTVLAAHLQELIGTLEPTEARLLGDLMTALEAADAERAGEAASACAATTAAAAGTTAPDLGGLRAESTPRPQAVEEAEGWGEGEDVTPTPGGGDASSAASGAAATDRMPESAEDALGANSAREAADGGGAVAAATASDAAACGVTPERLQSIPLHDLHRAMLPGECFDDDEDGGGEDDEGDAACGGDGGDGAAADGGGAAAGGGHTGGMNGFAPTRSSDTRGLAAREVKCASGGVSGGAAAAGETSDGNGSGVDDSQHISHGRGNGCTANAAAASADGSVSRAAARRRRRRNAARAAAGAGASSNAHELSPQGLIGACGEQVLNRPDPELGGAANGPESVAEAEPPSGPKLATHSADAYGNGGAPSGGGCAESGSPCDTGRRRRRRPPAPSATRVSGGSGGRRGSGSSSAYDTPTEGSGDDTEAAALSCKPCHGGADAEAVRRRRSDGSDASSGGSYSSARGAYGSAHGNTPERGAGGVRADAAGAPGAGARCTSGGSGGSGDSSDGSRRRGGSVAAAAGQRRRQRASAGTGGGGSCDRSGAESDNSTGSVNFLGVPPRAGGGGSGAGAVHCPASSPKAVPSAPGRHQACYGVVGEAQANGHDKPTASHSYGGNVSGASGRRRHGPGGGAAAAGIPVVLAAAASAPVSRPSSSSSSDRSVGAASQGSIDSTRAVIVHYGLGPRGSRGDSGGGFPAGRHPHEHSQDEEARGRGWDEGSEEGDERASGMWRRYSPRGAGPSLSGGGGGGGSDDDSDGADSVCSHGGGSRATGGADMWAAQSPPPQAGQGRQRRRLQARRTGQPAAVVVAVAAPPERPPPPPRPSAPTPRRARWPPRVGPVGRAATASDEEEGGHLSSGTVNGGVSDDDHSGGGDDSSEALSYGSDGSAVGAPHAAGPSRPGGGEGRTSPASARAGPQARRTSCDSVGYGGALSGAAAAAADADAAGSAGRPAPTGSESDASSTSTQEWPPRPRRRQPAATSPPPPQQEPTAAAEGAAADMHRSASPARPLRRAGSCDSAASSQPSVGFSGRRTPPSPTAVRCPAAAAAAAGAGTAIRSAGPGSASGTRGGRGSSSSEPETESETASASESDSDRSVNSPPTRVPAARSSGGDGGGGGGAKGPIAVSGQPKNGRDDTTSAGSPADGAAADVAASAPDFAVVAECAGADAPATSGRGKHADELGADAVAFVGHDSGAGDSGGDGKAAACGHAPEASPSSCFSGMPAGISDGSTAVGATMDARRGGAGGGTDDDDDDGEPGVSGRDASPPPSPSPQPRRPAETVPASPPPPPQQQQSPPQTASPQPPTAAAAAGADRTLSALLANLATAGVRPRCQFIAPAGAAAGGTGGAEGGGGGGGSADVVAAAAAQSYVMTLTGAAPPVGGFAAPPASVLRVVCAVPSRPEGLLAWMGELRAALIRASGKEQQRLYVVSDSHVRRWPPWLPALREVIAAALLGAARVDAAEAAADAAAAAAAAADEEAGGDGGGGQGRRWRQRRRRRRRSPSWLRAAVALLPLCELVVPYGGIYLFQAACRAYQGPSSPSDAARLRHGPGGSLRLDREGLAAAVAFMEAHPGNLHARALLMRFVGHQLSRALLASPRYGLRGAARAAESLPELVLLGGGGELCCGGVCGCGPTGHNPWAAAQSAAAAAGGGGAESGQEEEELGEEGEEGRVLRGGDVYAAVLGAALGAARQLQAVWRATWPGGHALRFASYSYLVSSSYPRTLGAVLNAQLPGCLEGCLDASELLAEARLLAAGPGPALMLAEEIFLPPQLEDEVNLAGAADEDDSSGTSFAFKQAVHFLLDATEPSFATATAAAAAAAASAGGGAAATVASLPPPWSQLSVRRREQLLEAMLFLSDMIMLVHAVLLVLRTAVSYAADCGGGAAAEAADTGAAGASAAPPSPTPGASYVAAAAAALRREVAEVTTMHAAASRMLVERMELQERSQEHRRVGGGGGVAAADGSDGGAAAAAAAAEERATWRHVDGMYERGKVVLQYAADAAAAMLDEQNRAEEADRCELLISALLADPELLEGVQALAALPPYRALPPPPPPAAQPPAEDDADDDASYDGADPAAEALYRLLVPDWGRRGGGGAAGAEGAEGTGDDADCGDGSGGDGIDEGGWLAAEFESASWAIPGLLRGKLRPVGQGRVRRMYSEVRTLAAESLAALERAAWCEGSAEAEDTDAESAGAEEAGAEAETQAAEVEAAETEAAEAGVAGPEGAQCDDPGRGPAEGGHRPAERLWAALDEPS